MTHPTESGSPGGPRRSAGPLVLAAACAVVGVLAARGTFDSIFNFPLVFAGVCLVLGAFALWRERALGRVWLRGALLLAGAAAAAGGWLYQVERVEARQAERRLEVLVGLEGSALPSLEGLEPLNTDRASWDEAASLDAPATVVAFWARWCSPCVQEMEELEVLYRRHRDSGLRVLSVTRYDRPDDPAERESDFAKARKFLNRRGHTFPSAITDDDELYRAYDVPGPPAVVLVDDRGIVRDYAVGLEDARALMAQAAEMTGAAAAGG